jgi:8-amino-7-oxononanoate synthase
MKRSEAAVAAALQQLERAHLRRMRRTVEQYEQADRIASANVAGRVVRNFCSNDYLGLARDPRMVDAMREAAVEWGSGAGAAHLVTGHTREHHALEEEIAQFTGREAALLFSTGYMANLGVLMSLVGRTETVVMDRLNHASLLDGVRQAGAKLRRYQHLDASDAAQEIAGAEGSAAMLATDGVFSMDGDLAPLAALSALALQYKAWLLVDDAHGMGVVGTTGRGAVELCGLQAGDVPLLIGTLGKAFGSFGAFVAGSHSVIELIMQRARSYIYTTALPPAVAAASRRALQIVATDAEPRERLWGLIARFRRGAEQLGIVIMPTVSAIHPIAVPGAEQCLAASRALFERGYWVSAIRPPTVPAGTERLRVTLTAAHTEAEVDGLLDALHAVLRQ